MRPVATQGVSKVPLVHFSVLQLPCLKCLQLWQICWNAYFKTHLPLLDNGLKRGHGQGGAQEADQQGALHPECWMILCSVIISERWRLVCQLWWTGLMTALFAERLVLMFIRAPHLCQQLFSTKEISSQYMSQSLWLPLTHMVLTLNRKSGTGHILRNSR